MNGSVWLKTAYQKLSEAGVGTARLDCLVILEDVTGKDRGWLLAHPEHELTKTQIKKLDDQIKRRAKHEPLAYIRGKTEFYGREFIVNKHVLEPRPESETMIDLLKNELSIYFISKEAPWKVVDVGTGSGALGITARLEIMKARVVLIDIDKHCLAVAEENLVRHDTEAELLQSDLLKNYEHSADVLLCNLPYVPDDWHINEAAAHEPRLAIFGGKDGLDLYRELFVQIKQREQKPKFVLTESLPPQHQTLQKIAATSNYKLLKTDDFIQVFTIKNTR